MEVEDTGVDGGDVSHLLPPEVWEIVFNQLDNPLDLLNCCRTCTTWEDILDGCKPQFLFTLVLPKIQQYLKPSDELRCRSVCKKWSQSIDTQLQKPPPWNPNFTQEDLFEFEVLRSRRLATLFSGLDDITHFQQDMAGVRNPFPKRTIVYSPIIGFDDNDVVEADGDRENQIMQFLSLLDKFGKHVWTLYFNSIDQPFKNFKYLHRIIHQLPNLRRLVVYMRMTNHLGENAFAVEQSRQYVQLNPLPRLEHLTSITTRTTGVHKCFLGGVFMEAYRNQIGHFDGLEFTLKREIDLERNPVFPNLEELKIWQSTVLATVPLDELSAMRMPLKRFALHFRSEAFQTVQLRELLATLDKFSASLEELHLTMELKHLTIEDYQDEEGGLETLRPVASYTNLKKFGISYSFLKYPLLKIILERFQALEVLEFVNHDLEARPPARRHIGVRSEAKNEYSVPSPISREEMCASVKVYFELVNSLKKVRLLGRQSCRLIYQISRDECIWH